VNKREREHLDKVARLGCIVCRKMGKHSYPEIHHIGNQTMGKRADHYHTIPLCPYHHRLGGKGEAIHAGRKSFVERWGSESELLAEVLHLTSFL